MKLSMWLACILAGVLAFGLTRAQTDSMTYVSPIQVDEVPWMAPPVTVGIHRIARVGSRVQIEGNWQVARVSGTSMVPLFGDGAALLWEPARPEDVRQGSIVMFRCKGLLVVHQVISITRPPPTGGDKPPEWEAITRGTNNGAADLCPVKADNLVAVVRGVLY